VTKNLQQQTRHCIPMCILYDSTPETYTDRNHSQVSSKRMFDCKNTAANYKFGEW
jgi:hypothetical protein